MDLEKIINLVEELLYNYKNYKVIIKVLEEKIKDLENGGDLPIICSNDYDIKVDGSRIFKSSVDKRQEAIDNYNKQISKYIQIINFMDINLENLKNEKYLIIIKLKYFENSTIEEISELLGIGITTVKRNKKRLLKKIGKNILPLFI